jgi:tetratricopeptide (TPR) repeat protein
VDQLAARLDQRFRLLTAGNRAALPRQQTLQATLDWSYALLSAPEQTLFTRLSVFAGSFTLEAAEAVCAGGAVAAEDVLDLLLWLVDKSLVSAEGSDGNVERYRLLETLRHFGRDRLLTGGEAEDLHKRYAAYYRALVEEAEPALQGPQLASWLDRLDTEWMNIRQALRWTIDAGDAQEGVRLAGALKVYWHHSGYIAEGVQWLTEVLALPGAAARTAARARALTGMAYLRRSARLLVGSQAVGAETRALAAEAVSLARETGDLWALVFALRLLGSWTGREDYATGRALLEECLSLCRDLDFQAGIPQALNQLGDVAWEQGDTAAARHWWSTGLRLARAAGDQVNSALQLGDLGMMAFHEGDYATARSQIEESLTIYRAAHDHMGISLALSSLGTVACAQGDTACARACYEEKLALWHAVGDRAGIAATLAELGALAQKEGDLVQAQSLFAEALDLRRALGHPVDVAASLVHLGGLAVAQGDDPQAATLYGEALTVLRSHGDRAVAALCLEGMAALALACGDVERAARLLGAAAPLRRGTYVLFVWDERTARVGQIAALRSALGEDAFAAAWAAGQAMSWDDALALACEATDAALHRQ